MLVLSRRENESIVIDGRMTVRIVAVQGGRVRLAIEAPREVPIRRSELPLRPDCHAAGEHSGGKKSAEPSRIGMELIGTAVTV